MELLVAAKDVVADDVVALSLVDPAGAELPEWAPGAHVDLILRDGLERQYSLCGDPTDRSAWRVAVPSWARLVRSSGSGDQGERVA
ncbi:hypothetical protein [uncultured Mycobacterium sp.]|uniref:hypothetical protein n=1 Tax=uncultured Mycobacterium sp. TaxID=171292 RepID=UPI0035CB5AFC